jgi:hypothetical protein
MIRIIAYLTVAAAGRAARDSCWYARAGGAAVGPWAGPAHHAQPSPPPPCCSWPRAPSHTYPHVPREQETVTSTTVKERDAWPRVFVPIYRSRNFTDPFQKPNWQWYAIFSPDSWFSKFHVKKHCFYRSKYILEHTPPPPTISVRYHLGKRMNRKEKRGGGLERKSKKEKRQRRNWR